MEGKQIVFTKPNTAELHTYEITLPMADQVALEISTISSGIERVNMMGEVNISIGKHPDVAVFSGCSGYSSAGRVLGVGENVKDLCSSDRVTMAPESRSSAPIPTPDPTPSLPMACGPGRTICAPCSS